MNLRTRRNGFTVRRVWPLRYPSKMLWRWTESNCRHTELQSVALPTELQRHLSISCFTVPTGIEPAISCVTGRRDNRYTTGPYENLYMRHCELSLECTMSVDAEALTDMAATLSFRILYLYVTKVTTAMAIAGAGLEPATSGL